MPLEKEESEHLQQVRFVAWFRKRFPDHWIFSNPNAGVRTPSQAARMKAEGMVAGIPDLQVPSLNLWVEMKTTTGKLSKEQKKIIEYLITQSHTVIVGYGIDDAKDKVLNFLGVTE